jgi:hypothetical protein
VEGAIVNSIIAGALLGTIMAGVGLAQAGSSPMNKLGKVRACQIEVTDDGKRGGR